MWILPKASWIVKNIPETFVWLFFGVGWHLVYASIGVSLQYSISHHHSYQLPQRSASPTCRNVKKNTCVFTKYKLLSNRTLRRNSFKEALSELLIVTTEEVGEGEHKQAIPFSEMSQATLLWEVLQLQHCYPIR